MLDTVPPPPLIVASALLVIGIFTPVVLGAASPTSATDFADLTGLAFTRDHYVVDEKWELRAGSTGFNYSVTIKNATLWKYTANSVFKITFKTQVPLDPRDSREIASQLLAQYSVPVAGITYVIEQEKGGLNGTIKGSIPSGVVPIPLVSNDYEDVFARYKARPK